MTVAASTIAGLQLALHSRLEALASRFPLLQTRSDDRRAPRVFDFDLPPKTEEKADLERFPYFVLRPRAGFDSEQDGNENARATFDVEVGTYSDDDDGELDLVMLIDAIRFDLGASPRIEGTAFEHVGPLTWETPFPQFRPHWLGIVTTIWSLPRPRRVEEV